MNTYIKGNKCINEVIHVSMNGISNVVLNKLIAKQLSHPLINVWNEKCISGGQSELHFIKALGQWKVFAHALQHVKWLMQDKYLIPAPLTVFIPVELFDLQ